jgi:hypothetical protein
MNVGARILKVLCSKIPDNLNTGVEKRGDGGSTDFFDEGSD